ncbi:hypothetical protein SAMN04489751_3129 [Brevibacterium sandarakinum]|uniref:Uncharacterized protein n=1 Tax=Brevibacterium sandarakinum TaxID=629680 RepID=A0A1H1VTF9_BRESA|nr:hypothetical protein SAMN04489751_3129 [Brevibacterium sandarakinum]
MGSAVLGCIGGVLAMVVLNDLVAGIWPEAVMVIAPLSLPVGALAGAGTAGVLRLPEFHRRSLTAAPPGSQRLRPAVSVLIRQSEVAQSAP